MTSSRRGGAPRALSAERWRSAALRALAQGGVAAVAIEPLAKRLGVTKGSGYWHFENREALLRATLEAWEIRATDDVIAKLDRIDDRAERLGALFRQAFDGSLDGRIYIALTGADHLPLVAETLRRVSSRRLAYLTECYEALYGSKTKARHRAVIAYAAYLGVMTLVRHQPVLRDREQFIEELISTLIE
jgi:AcrR family transcriptional regulator